MSKLKVHRWLTGIFLAAGLLLTGCAGPWKAAPDRLEATSWAVSVPAGWMRLSMPDSEMLSQNGPYLEYILIQSRPLTQDFRYTRQDLTADMLPHEAAQLIVDNLRSDPLIQGFQLLASEPAMIAGRPGFKLTYTYRDKYDVETKTVYFGTVLPNRFFNMRYTAARRYYFDKAWPVFEDVLKSLRLTGNRVS